jgi:hypothetical protein
MAIEKFIETFSLHELQHKVSKYGAGNVTLAVLLTGALAILADYAWMLYLRSKMPPGPLPLPIVGNTFQLPDRKPWIYFEQLAKQYNSPIITFWIGRYDLHLLRVSLRN